VLAARGGKASDMLRVFTPAPQKLTNIRYTGANPLESARVKAAFAEAEALLGSRGRMVLRKSGTEPLIRVMAEALDEALMQKALTLVADAVKAEA
jgi:phosphoglucosamine mutase